MEELKAGQKVEFGIAAGPPRTAGVEPQGDRPAAEPGANASRGAPPVEHKHTPDELHGMVEDMITLLEGAVQPELRKGRYPDRKTARRVSEVVKAVARELDA